VILNLPEVHTLAAMGLLWALEKGYDVAHMCDTYEAAGVYWLISRPSAAE
jgi:hypothetical protein